MLHFQLAAQAHLISGATSGWCSPHDADSSKGGSTFFNCDYDEGNNDWSRSFYCKSGTACSSGECPATKTDVCGSSTVDGDVTHAVGKGHGAPTVNYKTCANGCSLPQVFEEWAADEVECGETAQAEAWMNSSGEVCFLGNNAPGCSTAPGWIDPLQGMSNYEVKATLSGSALTSGTVNTWLSLGSNRWWILQAGYGAIKSSHLTFTVRKIGTTSPTWTSYAQLYADSGSYCE